MKIEQVLQLVADLGPNGAEAFHAWMALQWFKTSILAGFMFVLCAALLVVIYKIWRE